MEVPAKFKAPSLPVAKDGELYQHVGRHAGTMVMTAFEMIGGVDRFADWAGKHPEVFYTKVFPKIIARPAQVEHTASKSLEEAIRQLDAKTIDGEVLDESNTS